MHDVIKLPGVITEKSILIGTGTEHSRLNPIQDKNGNWIISLEEWNNPEFDNIKTKYSESVIKQFLQILWQPKTL